MPNIREYNSTQALQGIRPSELGADALAQSGRRIASVYHQAGEELGKGVASFGQIGDALQKRAAGGGSGKSRGSLIDTADGQSEIALGAASLAKTQEGLNQNLNQALNTSDLNDTTVGDKFAEQQLEPALQEWQSHFTTKAGAKWAAGQAQKTREHFYTKIYGDMSSRAGDALHVNMDNTLNSFSNGARTDPASMEHYIDQWKDTVHSLAETNPDLDPKVAGKAFSDLTQKGIKQIAQSAAIGAAEANPDAFLADVDKGRWNDLLEGTEINRIKGYAGQQQRQNEQKAKTVSENSADEYQRALFDPQTGQMRQVTPDMIGAALNDPRLLGPQRKTTVDWLQNQMKAQAAGARTSDPQLLQNFRQRFAGDPSQYPTQQQIGVAMANGQITTKDANELNSIRKMVSPTETKDPASAALFKDGISTAHTQILGTTPPGEASGAQRSALQRFDSWFYQNYQKATASGMTPAQLLNPDSPDYMLKPDTMKQFAISGSDVVTAPPSKPVPAYRPPLSHFFGAQPAKPMTDQEVFDNPKGGA